MKTKQIVDQALKVSNASGCRTGAFAERRTAQGADLMRYKTLLAKRGQSVSAGWAPVPKPAAMAKARNACRQAPAPAKIGRFVFRQTGRAELQPGRLRLWCATLLRRCPQGQTQPGQGVRSNGQSRACNGPSAKRRSRAQTLQSALPRSGCSAALDQSNWLICRAAERLFAACRKIGNRREQGG